MIPCEPTVLVRYFAVRECGYSVVRPVSRTRTKRGPERSPAPPPAPAEPSPGSLTPDVLARALLPLRAFLGFTFCFAGLQKLANPLFFEAGNPASIQAQLAGAARRSPIHLL